jgi:SAM-dependent methyltransferase
MMDLKSKMLCGIDYTNLKGLEIGPLMNPLVPKSDGSIYYLDRCLKEELAVWYKEDPTVDPNAIVDVDFVWGERRVSRFLTPYLRKWLRRIGIRFKAKTLKKSLGRHAPFDYCLACHVAEHVPDLISWLQQIAAVLKPGGILSMAVPDQRYTFDCRRPPTALADLLDAYLNKSARPSIRQVFDHFSNQAQLDMVTAWSPGFDPSQAPLLGNDGQAWAACLESFHQKKYVDTHCWAFTAEHFLDLSLRLSRLGLFDFRVTRFFKPQIDAFEFVVHLQKMEPGLSPETKHRAFLESYQVVRLPHKLKIGIQASRPGDIQVYYDYGFGFKEEDSVLQRVEEADRFQAMQIDIPPVPVNQIRLDTNMGAVRVGLRSLEIQFHGRQPIQVPWTWVRPFNEIASLKIRDNVLEFSTVENPTDPSLLIQLDHGMRPSQIPPA